MNWEQVWRDHWKEIYRYVYYRVHNRQEAEDVAQEAFLKLIRSDARYGEGQGVSIIALLKTTARNLLIDRWRKTAGRQWLPLDSEIAVTSDMPGPETLAEQKDEVQRALELLTTEQRKVVEYRLLLGYSIKDTAAILGKSESAVKTMQFRAIEAVRETLLSEQLNRGGEET